MPDRELCFFELAVVNDILEFLDVDHSSEPPTRAIRDFIRALEERLKEEGCLGEAFAPAGEACLENAEGPLLRADFETNDTGARAAMFAFEIADTMGIGTFDPVEGSDGWDSTVHYYRQAMGQPTPQAQSPPEALEDDRYLLVLTSPAQATAAALDIGSFLENAGLLRDIEGERAEEAFLLSGGLSIHPMAAQYINTEGWVEVFVSREGGSVDVRLPEIGSYRYGSPQVKNLERYMHSLAHGHGGTLLIEGLAK